MKDLKEKTIRGGSARMVAQASNFLIRILSMMVLARLLDPKDFGLVGMVTAFTGVLFLFRDFGLSAASVHREEVTKEQKSTLFWINVLVGFVLTAIAVAVSPLVGRYYHEPRLLQVTAIVAFGFLFNGAGVQHSALLQRQMRFTALAMIDIFALIVSTTIAIVMAIYGYGYWALAAMTVSLPFLTTIALWLTSAWVPGIPRRGVGMRSMMRFGGTMTLNGLVLYISQNFDKVLLGRYWGAEVVGIYGRAYQLIRIPTDNLNSAVGEVAFAALSRLQDDPGRLRRYFLKGYSLVVALTLPITVASALFSEDIVLALLGPQWKDAAGIFRLLAPTILVFAIANPLGWLLNSLGLVARGLKIALVFAPFMLVGCLIGLPHGASGVALAYSVVMTLWLIPFVVWAVHGTTISVWDIVVALRHPFVASVIAAGLAFGVRFFFGSSLSLWPRLILEAMVLLVTYAALLLFAAGQKSVYMDVLRGFKGPATVEDKSLASA
ncbi:MAG TPA: lipopolysaccharide biosynthesis protein [Terriglobia bacterium]|nr:lipopolysaccharide biosynthesis protein [Terriglobia bacterium]